VNTHQLVLRCDTTNGYYKVGWASDLPLGRFKHIELLLEVENLIALKVNNPTNQHFTTYIDACKRVSVLNQSLITQEQRNNQASGWFNVALNLSDQNDTVTADEFGCFNNIATKTRYRLSKNCRVVWAVVKESIVVQIEARYPDLKIDELKYQIWKQHKLGKLNESGGDIKEGKLLVCHSGLWFVAENLV
jgi:hypothetical protein